MIDKKSNNSIYFQIAEKIRIQIEEGLMEEGDLIDSENKLSEIYKVSRLTARRALDFLVNKGYLYRIKGKGTFVNKMEKIQYTPQNLIGFTEEILSINKIPKNKVITFEVIKAEKLGKKLNINEEELVYHVVRLRYANEEPLMLEKSYLPVKLFPELNISVLCGSKYAYVEKYTGVKIIESLQEIEAYLPNEEEKNYLKTEDPLLKVSNQAFLENGAVFEYSISYFSTNKNKFIQKAIRYI
ncbi:MAG: GntR family transcriptional regulator [Fusobacteriaceae bacterium]|nr:GntR family transcriptional regulator [Fusobacteriaceae bacterium]MBN2837947.1 GntR family transcriptional regulator [Fusobacteriaceae bacterium]